MTTFNSTDADERFIKALNAAYIGPCRGYGLTMPQPDIGDRPANYNYGSAVAGSEAWEGRMQE